MVNHERRQPANALAVDTISPLAFRASNPLPVYQLRTQHEGAPRSNTYKVKLKVRP